MTTTYYNYWKIGKCQKLEYPNMMNIHDNSWGFITSAPTQPFGPPPSLHPARAGGNSPSRQVMLPVVRGWQRSWGWFRTNRNRCKKKLKSLRKWWNVARIQQKPSCCYPGNTPSLYQSSFLLGGRKPRSSLAAFRRPRLPIWTFEDWPGLSEIRTQKAPEKLSKPTTSPRIPLRKKYLRFHHHHTGCWAHGLPTSFLEAPERLS